MLKKWVKRECGGKWQKYYVNQVVHRVMFEVLLRCYRTVRVYRNEIYEVIADQLNMKRAISDALQIEDGDDEEAVIQEHQSRLLSNIFGPYFKNNFEFVLLRKLEGTASEDPDDDRKMDDGNLVDSVMRWMQSEFVQYLGTLDGDEKLAMREYIRECLEVCWVMILQDPPLQIQPDRWKASELSAERTVYDEKYHKRVLGSDRHCKDILYFVWPAVSRKGVVLGDQKVDVLLRKEMYTETKHKK